MSFGTAHMPGHEKVDIINKQDLMETERKRIT